ncbi:MAG TPA: DNA-processing protein DprA [bacterium]|nr:DNA-processing protein DprA [bacterium]
MDENKLWQIAFNHLISFNFNQYNLLLKYFGNFKEAFYAHSSDLRLAGLKEKTIEQLILKRKTFNLWEGLKFINKENISVCFYEDPDYPIFLKNIFSPPPLLYYRGNLNIDWKMSLSVVGARNHSYYGEKIINSFIPQLVKKSINIVSGLALGIDSLAHVRSIENSGQTVAVLGSGLDNGSIYPYKNKKLFYDIIDNNGLVLSEFCPKTKPLSFNFPQRNRIIAGLSMSTLVIEAGEKSGSLITANQALEEGRNVLVFPGDVCGRSFVGSNNLIKNGAYLVNNTDDIYQFYVVI